MSDDTLHIHSGPTDACVACGTAYSASLLFLTDIGKWNRSEDRCSEVVVKPDYTTVSRDDRRTSALNDERQPRSDRIIRK